ncbi:FkbM family methyltransferase [Mariniflexile sp.]
MITELLNLPFKIVTHYKTLGYQGTTLLAKRYIKKYKRFYILLKGYRFPVVLRNNTTDVTVFYQVFLARSYSIKVKEMPRVIIDCGANIGLSAVFFKNKFPEAKIIALEPEHSNFEMLKKNTKMYEGIHCINKGIWNKSTNLIIKDNNLGNWGFMVEEVDNDSTISATSIEEIMCEFNIDHIDILKVDIEGSEKELFERNFEKWLSKTKILIIELHDGLRAGASKSVFNAISKYDFHMVRKDENFIFYFNQK